jgi:hypothetical protein
MNRRDFIKGTTAGALGFSLFRKSSQLYAATAHPFKQRFRQIHLDFHTSEYITDIGSQFDPDEFADTLKKAHVDSVNCFGRCHHGWIYYDTKKFPERRHPHLTRNLLPQQIEACHKRDIRVPIYLTLQADYFTVKQHPEWRLIGPDGMPAGGLMNTPSFWKMICLNTPYVDFLKAHIAELFELMPVDGLWLDIIEPRDCSCQYCWTDMEKQDFDPRVEHDRHVFADKMITEFMLDMTDYIRTIDKECTVFYNSGHIWPFHRRALKAFTHFDLESLSSSMGWPYPYFQTTARYARTLGKDIVGMTGKFHSTWGDFHSFKNKAALEFDCFQSLAVNAQCSIGDQLHPSGKIDPVTYDLVGSVYSQVEAKQPWCEDATAVSEIGILTTEEWELIDNAPHHPSSLTGAVRMMLEEDLQFDVVDSDCDLSKYKVLLLPDDYTMHDKLKLKLKTFLNNGGHLIASFEAAMDKDKTDFQLAELGVKKASDEPLDEQGKPTRGQNSFTNSFADYVIPVGEIGAGLEETEYVMYSRGVNVGVTAGEVLLYNTKSYFDRQYKHFSSHRQTPSSGEQGTPAVVKNGNVIYFAHPIFTMYFDKAPFWCKQLFINAVKMLIGQPLVETDAPSTAIVTLNEQKNHSRHIVHVIHYVPERRGQEFDIIEDVIPLHDVKVRLKTSKNVKSVRLVPQKENIDFEFNNGAVQFIIPKVNGHQMVEIAQSEL